MVSSPLQWVMRSINFHAAGWGTYNAEAAITDKSRTMTKQPVNAVSQLVIHVQYGYLFPCTAGKLDSHWDGRWRIKSVKSPLTVEITEGEKTKIAHVNRVCHRQVPNEASGKHPSNQIKGHSKHIKTRISRPKYTQPHIPLHLKGKMPQRDSDREPDQPQDLVNILASHTNRYPPERTNCQQTERGEGIRM